MNTYIKIQDLNDPALSIYKDLNEIQLKRFYEPAEGLFICESPKVIRRALAAGYEPVSLLMESKYLEGKDSDIPALCEKNLTNPSAAKENPFMIFTAPPEVLIKLTGYYLTGGMLCAMRRRPLPSAQDLCKDAHRIAVFEDVENPTNIGAMFRSAAALGIDAVLLTEGCSDPLYRRAARVSVGTVFQIPWTWIHIKQDQLEQSSFGKHFPPTTECHAKAASQTASASADYIERLHAMGFKTAALALTEKTISIDDPILKGEEKLAILLGNEGNGLLPETISKSDYAVKIPMPEGVDSLNVAAASAVAFWELRDKK